jgi:hypothetical protein
MQSGQVAAWIPLVTAVIAGILAISGTVAGQLVNARREERRWIRQHVTDKQEQLRQTRLNVLGEFVNPLHRWYAVLDKVEWSPSGGKMLATSEQIAQMEALREEIQAPLSKVFLVASRKLADECDAVVGAYEHQLERIKKAEPFPPVIDLKASGKRISQDDFHLEIFFDLLDLMRKEIDVEPISLSIL